MSRNTMIAVTAATLILVIAATLSVNKREAAVESESKTPEVTLLPEGTAEKLPDAARIVIEGKDETVTLEKKDEKWTVSENEGFFADEEKIRTILTGFGRFKPLEEKTSNPELYSKLGVGEPDEEDSTSVRVTVEDGGGKEIASALLGRIQSGTRGEQKRYVRVPGNESAWLVGTPLDAAGGKDAFTVRQILDVAPETWRSVEITTWKEPEVISMDRPTSDSKDWQVANVPEDREVTGQSSLDAYLRPLQRLTHSAVTRMTDEYDDYTSPSGLSAVAWDGLELTVTLRADENEDFWAKFDVSVDESAEGFTEETGETVDALLEMTDGWLFKLSRWASNAMTNDRDSFLKVKESPPIEASQILVAWSGSGAEAEVERTKEEALERAQELLERVLENPDDFEQVAREESDDTGSREDDGALGEFSRGLFEDAFDEAAFSLDVGGISDVVETSTGYHVIKRTK